MVFEVVRTCKSVTPVLRNQTTARRANSPRRTPVVLLGSLAVSGYFAFHALNGTHGLLAQNRLIARSTLLDREIAALDVVRRRLKQDVLLLRGDPPHPDLVGEHARSVLGFVNSGDLIVLDRN